MRFMTGSMRVSADDSSSAMKIRLDDIDNRPSIEDKVKKMFIKAVKDFMGKGPREIIVHVSGSEVRIIVVQALTVMEENLMKDTKNYEVVRQARNMAYEKISQRFETVLANELGYGFRHDKIIIDLKKKVEQISFLLQE